MLDYKNLFSPNHYEKNDKRIKVKKLYCVICCKYRKFEKPIIPLRKTLVLSIICSKCENEDKKLIQNI